MARFLRLVNGIPRGANETGGLIESGFDDPSLVDLSYDPVSRTVSIAAGTQNAYLNGVYVPKFTSAWQSSAHTDATGVYWLYENDSGTQWSTSFPGFDQLLIATILYNSDHKFAIRECHSIMPWRTHKNLHESVGTYRESGGDLSAYTIGSTTDKQPDVSQCKIMDEDLVTTLLALTSKKYTKFALTGSGSDVVTTPQSPYPISVLGNQPYYNSWSGTAWGQTLVTANNYTCIWLIAVPVDSSVLSRAYKFLWVQGQSEGSLASQQGLSPQDVNLGTFGSAASEFVFLAKIIIRYTASNWSITSVTKLTGSRYVQTGSPGGTYLSSVATDSTLSGSGTPLDPLSVIVPTIYDQSLKLVASGPGAGEILGPITTGTPITLPNSQTYTGEELEVYLNGQRIDDVFDFNYVGSGTRTQISMTFDLMVGDIIRFRIDRKS